jgi:acyl dehydratase
VSYGRYFDDFSVGQEFRHWPGRTITEADCTWFALLTMNQHPCTRTRHYAETYTHTSSAWCWDRSSTAW